jgi:hypothetical protein
MLQVGATGKRERGLLDSFLANSRILIVKKIYGTKIR